MIDYNEFAAVLRHLKSSIRNITKDMPVKFHEFGILIEISKHNNMITPSELSEILEVSRPAITPFLNSLEANGYIKREISAEDRRSIFISLTKKGRELESRTKQRKQLLLESFIEKLGENDAKELMRIMKKAEIIIKEITNEG